jgi:hypothetical protein
MKKILLAFGAVVVIAVVGRGFWAYQQMDNKAPVVVETTLPKADEMAGWKTYINDKYGFSFEYPSDFEVYGGTFDYSKGTHKPPTADDNFILIKNPNEKVGDSIKSFAVNITIDKPITDWAKTWAAESKEKQYSPSGAGYSHFLGTTTVANTLAATYEDCFDSGCETTVHIPRNNITYLIQTVPAEFSSCGAICGQSQLPEGGDPVYFANLRKESIEFRNQILSTFKFTNATVSDGSADWKTYTSSKYGFSIQYPKGAQMSDVDISGGRNISFTTPQGTVMVEVVMSAWRNGVLSAPANCEDFDSGVVTRHVSINGVDFVTGDVSRDLSGMNSTTSATEYCTIQNGIGYKIIPRMPVTPSANPTDVNSNTILNRAVKSFTILK